MGLKELLKQMKYCSKCGLCKTRTQVVLPATAPNPQIMLVGEAPGADEDIMGSPFVGRAGDLLNKMLKEAGLERDQIYISNTVKCRPSTNGGRKNRPPTDNEIEQCRGWLWKEIQLIKPKVIVTLGKVPTRLLLKLKKTFKLGDHLGKTHNMDYCEADIIPALHPSFILQYGKDRMLETIDLLRKVKNNYADI